MRAPRHRSEQSTPHRPGRSVRLFGNGQYSVMLTGAGTGYSHWRDLAITRWREDPTCDDWGSFIVLRDLEDGALWSATHQPLQGLLTSGMEWTAGMVRSNPVEPPNQRPRDGRALYASQHHDLDTTLEVAVAIDHDAELRRLTVHNRGNRQRQIELTSYAELVLAPAGSEASHPAFSKLFVQTHWEHDGEVLLATRRKRTPDEPGLWAAHCVVTNTSTNPEQTKDAKAHDATAHEGAVSYETDRARFLGRGNRLAQASALHTEGPLPGTVGTVLDPVFSLRTRIFVAAGATVSVDFWTIAGATRDDVVTSARRLRSEGGGSRVVAGTTVRVPTSDSAPEPLSVADEEAAFAGSDESAGAQIDSGVTQDTDGLLAPLHYADRAWRAASEVLRRGHGGSSVLWSHGISGDRPIIVLRIAGVDCTAAAESLLQAQRRWRRNWFGADLVLLDTRADACSDGADDSTTNSVSSGTGDDDSTSVEKYLAALERSQSDGIESDGEGAKAELFVLRETTLEEDFRDGLFTAARVVLEATESGWSPIGREQDRRDPVGPAKVEEPSDPTQSSNPSVNQGHSPTRQTKVAAPTSPPTADEVLEFDNGLGGFCGGGRDYRIVLDQGAHTPAPWINVVASPDFGFIASAEGGGYTWSGNSQQNPLTPWPNDPVTDSPHEILYLHDQNSGELWSATPEPIRVDGTRYVVTHGKGWSRTRHSAHGLDVELLQYVPTKDSIKLSRLKLHNRGDQARDLSITGYVQWALGPNGATTSPFVITEMDEATGALFARNPWRAEFAERVAFIDLGGAQDSASGDRLEFLGPYGTVVRPAALSSDPLSGRVGAGLDPCGALRARVTLEPDQAAELVFALGDAESRDGARELVRRYREADLDAVLDQVSELWSGILDIVQVETPDRALDLMINDWLLYQCLGCRVWARSAYYQSSGAYGFRDQLQDVLSLCVARPDLTREHIVRSAGRQFPPGDVQHWWLPPSGQGIRTRMSDDRLWLPFVTAHYILTTGDSGVLDERVPFLAGDPLEEGRAESFFQPKPSDEVASVYEHCARSIDVSLELGAHGLPLIGTGDWNDGMNRVGDKGDGESVWLAWLLIATIEAYSKFAETHNDDQRLEHWHQHVAALRKSVEDSGWDGEWYRRGYYDDGTPLGSARSLECRIDTIAQSWSAIASASDRSHVVQAMDSVDEHLLQFDHGLALLFTPPFDDGPMDPGYIKGYPPGLRENGGQYTHGAIWSVFAFASLGQGDKAGALFSLLNPIHHSDTPENRERYKVEPYVACADLYSVAPHIGRGGWTWYTGSGGWLYRAGLEALLGFHLRGAKLLIDPCIPAHWPGFKIDFRHLATRYLIEIENPRNVQTGVASATLDGESVSGSPAEINLVDDAATHRWILTMGPAQ